jgi:Predicted ATPase
LGYDDVALAVAQSLRDGTEINVILGPPGIGKSWLAKGIGAIWERAGGSTVVAQGDLLRSDVPLYPLGFAMAGLSSGWRTLGTPLAATARAGESLVGTAGIITATVQTIARLRPKRRRARSMFLGDAEQQILFDLERLASKRPLLLIADNLHWWDPASLEFLDRLREPRMREAFPFLFEMRLLAAETTEPYQHVSNPDAHEALLSPATTRYFELSRVPRERFEDVLVALGAPRQPAAEFAIAMYGLTGGHLALARRCAARLEQGESELFTAAADAGDFVAKLLTERIRSLGSLGTEAVALLQIAAVLGLRFRRDEVTCASGGDQSATSRLLRYLREQDLVELSDDAGWFVHDLYRQHFLAVESFDRTAIHERLSDCLRMLSPADYELRCQNAIEAERPREAATLGVQAGLARLRDGLSSLDLSAAVLGTVDRAGFVPVAERFKEALEHLNHDRYAECLTVMSSLPHALPEALSAEADYLRAACLMSTRSDEDRADGRALLEAWSGYESQEPELGIRLMQLHLFGLTMLPDKRPGRVLEGRIKEALRRRVSFDQAAEDAMYTLDRCSASLYEPDVSLIRTTEAVDHFGPAEGQTVVRRPVEYYRCLVNLAAELVVNARYSEARAISAVLDQLVGEFTPGVFPRLDHPYTTALLAEYRLGVVDAEEALRRQRDIIERHGVPGDPFYAENALGVYLTLVSGYDEALEVYDRLLVDLTTRRNPEPSMLYLIRANRCAARFVSGNRHDVSAEWAELHDVVRRIPYTFSRVLVRRHELLAAVIDDGKLMSPREFDECLVVGRRPEFGPMWDQLGRGFRMPEVEKSLVVLRGDVVREGVEGPGWGLPSERAVGPVVIVEVDEAGVAGGAFSF